MSDEDNKRKFLPSKGGVPAKSNYQPPARRDNTSIATVIEDCAEIKEKLNLAIKLASLNGGTPDEYRETVPMLPQIWTVFAEADRPATPEHIRAIACWLVEVKPQANVIDRAEFITGFCAVMEKILKPTTFELVDMALAVFRFDQFLSMPR